MRYRELLSGLPQVALTRPVARMRITQPSASLFRAYLGTKGEEAVFVFDIRQTEKKSVQSNPTPSFVPNETNALFEHS